MTAYRHVHIGMKYGAAFFIIWFYYFLWVIILPFCEGSFLERLFPERRYAIEGPVLIGVIFVCGVAWALGKELVRDAERG